MTRAIRLIGVGMLLGFGLVAATAMYALGSDQPIQSSATAQPSSEVEKLAAQVAASAPTLQQRYPRYLIQRSDVLDLDFALTPEFNQTVTVQPDGFISLRGVGAVYVAGQTVSQAADSLREAYAKILVEPVIAVVLKDFEKPYFVASGEFNKPGKIELRDEVTVTQAVAMAGGFTGSAKHSQVLLFRRVSDQWVEVKKLDVKRMLAKADLKEDPTLHPGDMLHVPKSAMGKIKQFIPAFGMGVHYNPRY